MTFKHMVLGAVSASAILMSLSTVAPTSFSMSSSALAETSVSVNFGFGSFYDRLEPYGNWVSYQDQYVFLPHHVDHGWRPYTLGHWSYTQRYGWMWVSSERFGWATYHYGRWGYSRDIGWYWVPGRRWAPAWVAWSRGHNEVAWAPLPPHRGGGESDVNVSITIGDVPDYYWQAVPTSAFLSINLSNSIIRDRNQVRTIVQQSPPETVHIENNIVINNVIQVNEIEKATNTKVVALTEKPVTNPDAVGKSDSNSITIFNPDVQVDDKAKPKKALKVEEVVTDRKAKGIEPSDVPTEQPVVPGQAVDKKAQPDVKVQVPVDGKASTDAPAATTDKAVVDPAKPAVDGNAKVGAQGTVDTKKAKEAPAVTPPAPADTPLVKKPPVDATPVVKAPAVKTPDVTPPVVEAPAEKPKQDKTVTTPPADTAKPKTDVPVDKPKAGTTEVPKDAQKTDQQKTDQQPKDQNANGKKPKDEPGKVKCDPNVETCPPAQ
jgi:hypothetical protein